MKLRTFQGNSMAEALAQVQRALGSDAVILHTRNIRQGGLLGLFGRNVVEVTAARPQEVARRRPRSAPAARDDAAPAGRQRPRPASTSPAAARPSSRGSSVANASTGDLIRRTYQVAQAALAQKHAQQQQQHRPAATAAGRDAAATAAAPATTSPPPDDAHGSQLAQEMRLVRQMVSRLMAQQQSATAATAAATASTGSAGDEGGRQRLARELPPPLLERYLQLLEQEVSSELAEQVVMQVRSRLGEAELAEPANVRRAVLEALACSVPTGDGCLGSDASIPPVAPTEDGRPRTIALVGPTGVGKTTTVAKLAATFKLQHGCQVGLITLDTYRIAAVEQLRTYAQIIGVPLHVASSEQQLADALGKFATCDVVLIDTAGRSQRDDPRLEQLARLIDTADPHEVHLVLASTSSQKVILDAVERFSRIRTDRIIFTKLDEAVNFGVIVTTARQVNKQLSYLTTGQEVPHQIEPMRPQRLARLVVSGELEPSGAERERTVAG